MPPDTAFAGPIGRRVAYQVMGDVSNATPIVLVTNWVSNVDVMWENPRFERFLRRLAEAGPLIVFDKLGTGVSDPLPVDTEIAVTVEQGAADLLTVLDAVGVDRVALVSTDLGGWVAMLFAATWPERVASLVLTNTCARFTQGANYPYGVDPGAGFEEVLEVVESMYGHGINLLLAPSALADEELVRWMGKYERLAAPLALQMSWWRSARDFDLRSVLPLIAAPTLVVHHAGSTTPVDHGRYLAEQLRAAHYVELPGADGLYFLAEGLLDVIIPFITGSEPSDEVDRVLATVLFTDIVDSTRLAASLGDRRWLRLLDDHDLVVSQAIRKWRGVVHKMTGDGVLGSFDGPARAARCALAIDAELNPLGLEARAGLHTGEIERRGDDVGGIAVHVAARIAALAGPHEVLASRTVKDLTTGSGLSFTPHGTYSLKGVPDQWEVYEVANDAALSAPPLGRDPSPRAT